LFSYSLTANRFVKCLERNMQVGAAHTLPETSKPIIAKQIRR